MKGIKRFAVTLATCLMLAGCAAESSESAAENGSSKSMAHSSANSSAAPENSDNSANAEKSMPVINIQTKNTNALDFVTTPVTRLVAERIATWTPNYQIPPEPYYEECTVSVIDGDKQTVIDSANASVKVRGNWTTTYNKKPLRIKFEAKQSMLGLNGGNEYKNWLLFAEYKDFSMLRNRTAFQLAEEILGSDGYYSADSRLVEVNINGKYWGVYLLTEYQQINIGRVDITEAEPDYTGTDIGYFLEYDGYFYAEDPLQRFKVDYHNDAPLNSRGGSDKTTPTAGGKNIIGVTIKSDIYSQEQHDFIERFVNNVYDIMYEAAYNDKAFVMSDDFSTIAETTELSPREAVEKVVDVRSLVDSYILAELTCDADIYWSSFFMDADFGSGGSKKLRFEAPWDFDSAFGNKDRCADGIGFYAGSIIFDVDGNYKEMCNPWLMVSVNEDWFNDAVKERWTEIYNSGAFDRAYELISSECKTYSAEFDRNYKKWDNIRHNDAANEFSWQAAQCSTQGEAAEYLQSWLKSRVEFLNSQWLL